MLNIHPFQKALCPAWGATCGKCKGKNHLAVACPNTAQKHKKPHRLHAINHESDSSSDPEFISAIHIVNEVHTDDGNRAIFADIEVQGRTHSFQVDPGATTNVVPLRIYPRLHG